MIYYIIGGLLICIGVYFAVKLKDDRTRVPKATGRQHDFRRVFWGHNIMSHSKVKDGVFSCLVISTPLPRPGDDLLIPMKSGKTGICRVLKVSSYSDPSDMASVEYGIVGYL
jgi:hypothetical protein